jgi:hypothetical protein
MADREQLELLASRLLDGDLSPDERAALDDAMAGDPGLREFAARLQRVHDRVNLLANQRLPQDFTARVLQGIEVEAPVLHLPFAWAHWAAAAAVMLTLGLLVGAAVINNSGRPSDVDPIAIKPDIPDGSIGPVVRGPSASVVAFSQGQLELLSQQGISRTSRFEGELSLPAEVAAPADTYAVVEVKGGTAVLSPGARARLNDTDLDGLPDFEPIDGDLYLESNGGMQSRVGAINLNTQGGVTLRHTSEGYRAEPSHGITRAGELELSHRQWAKLYGGMQVSDRDQTALDDWAIRGRADAIKLQLRKLLGPNFDKIPSRHWEKFDKLLCGVLSRPWERATYAYMIRFLLKHNFLEEATSEEKAAWASIAAILAEGTTESDVPVQIRDLIAQAEEAFAQNPQQLEEFKTMLRDSMER